MHSIDFSLQFKPHKPPSSVIVVVVIKPITPIAHQQQQQIQLWPRTINRTNQNPILLLHFGQSQSQVHSNRSSHEYWHTYNIGCSGKCDLQF